MTDILIFQDRDEAIRHAHALSLKGLALGTQYVFRLSNMPESARYALALTKIAAESLRDFGHELVGVDHLGSQAAPASAPETKSQVESSVTDEKAVDDGRIPIRAGAAVAYRGDVHCLQGAEGRVRMRVFRGNGQEDYSVEWTNVHPPLVTDYLRRSDIEPIQRQPKAIPKSILPSNTRVTWKNNPYKNEGVECVVENALKYPNFPAYYILKVTGLEPIAKVWVSEDDICLPDKSSKPAAPAALNLAIGDRVLYTGDKNVMQGKRGTVIGTYIASNGVTNVDVRWDGSPYPASRRILRDKVKKIPKTTCLPSINGQFVCINPESSLCGTRGVVVDILQNGNIHARMMSGPMLRETIVLRPEAIEMIAPGDSRYKKSEA